MKNLVYTCVFGGYDRVFPPLHGDPSLDHVLVTDDPKLRVKGWRTHAVPASRFATPKAANLYYRALIHRELPGYDGALYVDGNIRLLGPSAAFIAPFMASGAALGLYPHPLRQTVASEAQACLQQGKLANPDALHAERAFQTSEGFPDDQGLMESGILLKNHKAPGLDAAMALWWEQFERFGTRDQISLPYVLWKSEVSVQWHDHSFRDPNPYFGLYPHRGARGVNPAYADLVARAYGSPTDRALLWAWDSWRALRRRLKSGRST